MDYKNIARSYFAAVNAYDQALVSSMIREDYIQHNPKVPTGSAAFVGFLPVLEAANSQIENIRMLSDGPYIIMHHLWHNAEPFGYPETAAFHIIRFDHEKIAEHWNVMTPVGAPNRSGRSLTDGGNEITGIENTEHNRDLVAEFMSNRLTTGSNNLETVCALDMIQHHPLIEDGVDSYKSFTDSQQLKLDRVHRVFAEGNFVLAITEGTLGGEPHAFYDLFRLESSKIVEHWNIYQVIPTENLANDNTMFRFDQF